ncbi:MAG: response regulator receiver protein [Candidatus Magnetoglobus multicellularis str. Araruama]|uniref:Response regulator receiver protein n=1 Tax=Candidatus Magnetoglobus multicellularis str. Araruama TaxID=890399 RepID=A0A1V1P939_9BACT|nr:MAG: response regulator receiver protein [Candidatus Magnetoglobus multicellularis str. Araruama]
MKKHQGKGTIIIMDDQQAILKMLARLLTKMGYQTELCTDGLQVIEKYKEAIENKAPYDLVILDLTVPGGMGGEKTIKALLEIDPNIKAIVSSGYSNSPIMANHEDYGFCGVVTKPYTRTELAGVLNEIGLSS